MMLAYSSWLIGHRFMLKGIFYILFFLSTMSYDLRANAAEYTSSSELIENAKAFDKKTVLYKGEAVTAIMDRGEHSWVNVNDGQNAIGIWCEKRQLGGVKFLGDYKNRGDMLEIEGVFNRACPLHGGELDIHAYRIRVLEPGSKVSERVDRHKLRLAVALFLTTLAVIIIFRKRII